MGVLTVADFQDEILSGLGNRPDISLDRVVRALNLAQGRIGRAYDFSELSVVSFAQMNFTGAPAIDKYMIPPPRTKTIHSFVVLDTSSANGAFPPTPPGPSSGGIIITGDDGTVITGDDGTVITGDPAAPAPPVTTQGIIITGDDGTIITGDDGTIVTGDPVPVPPTPPRPIPPAVPFGGVIGSLGQSRKVVEKPWRWFDRHFPAPEWIPAGWPEIYKRFGNIITMVPPPFLQFTAQLSFTQYATPFTTTNLTQVSDYENKDDVIVEYALAWFWKELGRNDRAVYFEGLAKEQLDEAIDKDDTRPDIEVSRDIPAIGGSIAGPYWAMPFVKSSP
jgi:hypothetical protein